MDERNHHPAGQQQPLSEEEIKAIGEIEIGPARHEVFLNNHYKKLILGIIGISLVGAISIAYYSHHQDAKETASSLIVAAMQAEQPGLVAQPSEYDNKALENAAKGYANTPSAATAQLMQGLKLLGEKPEDGISQLQELTSNSNVIIASRAAAALGNYYMQESRTDEAKATWQKLAQMGESPYQAFALLSLGDIAKVSGDIDTARSFYTQAQKQCETSSLVIRKDVEMRLMMLNVDPPVPVQSSTPTPMFDEADAPEGNNAGGLMDSLPDGGTLLQ